MKKYIAVLLLVSLAAALVYIFCLRGRQKNISPDMISQKLDYSVSFIVEEYDRNKIFETFLCKDDHSECKHQRSSLFISATILNSVLELERNEQLDRIIEKETERTLFCQNEQLLWDFYCKKSSEEKYYYPDLDSTSMASWFLSSRNIGHHLDEIREQIRKTQFHNGALLTFLRDFQPPPHSMNQDPVANANALVLLSEEIPSVCEFINSNFDRSIYYTDDVVVFYMLSKAYSRGAKCIKPALAALYDRIRAADLLKKEAAPMHLSMLVTALMKYDGAERELLDGAIKSLLENTKELPFKEYFFRTGLNMKLDFYYSPAFSAAVYAEALTNIKSYQLKAVQGN